MEAADGEERVLATAQHIVRSLGTDGFMTDDMLKIFSEFDNRFSSMNDRLPKAKLDATATSSRQGGNEGVGEKDYEDGREEVLEKECPDLEAVGKLFLQWDISSSDVARQNMIWELSREESGKYLEAVDEVRNVLNSFNCGGPASSELVNHAQSLEGLAMSRLEEEFRHMLRVHSESLNPDWLIEKIQGSSLNSSVEDREASRAEEECGKDGDEAEPEEEEEDVPLARPLSDLQVDLLPPEIVSDLSDIARRMILAGYEWDCSHVYICFRRASLEESLAGLPGERHSSDEVQRMDWDSLEGKILKWIQAMKISVKILFASERRLCDEVFTDFSTSRENCFALVAKNAMMQLLSFSEAISIGKRKPEKLFKILDMYEVLRDLLPEIEATFTGEECAVVRTKADEILTRLGDAARGTFAEFEDLIQNDTSKSPVPGGAVHPLTRYVMNYIRFLFEYTDTLKQLFGINKKEEPKLSKADSKGRDRDGKMRSNEKSPLAVQTIYITEVLERNLDAKSKAYKDIALTYLFLMNNVHYIAQKVKTTEVRSLLGDDWVRRHSSMVRQHATSYQRASWNKVLQCLRDEGIHTTGSAASSVSRVVLKDRFKSFNIAFEDVHKVQSGWIVPDPQLRDELRVAIAEKLLPAYRSFLGRYRWYLESGKRPDKYIKFSSDDLENHLNDLFEGSSGSMTLRRRSFAPP